MAVITAVHKHSGEKKKFVGKTLETAFRKLDKAMLDNRIWKITGSGMKEVK